MNNLFELSSQYQMLMDKINDTDEISDELMQHLIEVNDSLENKILNYASIIKTMEAKVLAIDHAVESMLKRQKSLHKSAEKLREMAKLEMQKCDKKKIENAYHKAILIQNNPKVQFSDKNLIPESYMRKKIQEIIEPNTILISKALKENIAVPGAYLVKDQRLEIR